MVRDKLILPLRVRGLYPLYILAQIVENTYLQSHIKLTVICPCQDGTAVISILYLLDSINPNQMVQKNLGYLKCNPRSYHVLKS